MPEKKTYPVFIDKLVPGGFGLGRRDDGIVVLVRHVLPGEKVLVREAERRKHFIVAEIEAVLEGSADRIEPPCPLYGRCGGCNLQHATARAQLRLKKEILTESLQRAADDIFFMPERYIKQPLASPVHFGYRQRIRLQVDEDSRFGFFRPESHVLEPAAQCLLAKAGLNHVLQQLHASNGFAGLARQSSSFELFYDPGSNDTFVLLHFARRPRPADCSNAAAVLHGLQGLSGIMMQVAGYGLYDPQAHAQTTCPPSLSQTLAIAGYQGDLSLSWEATTFCQVNLEQNRNLVTLVLDMVASGPHTRVLDLYCGFGNFSLPVSRIAGNVLGLDGQNGAIRSAKRNAVQNGAGNCCFEKTQVARGVAALIREDKQFDTIILDPPRQGAPDIISLLPALGAEQIIYISCDPSTLARDLVSLRNTGYVLSSLVPVDMFPQTHHLESVALLKRAGK